jgi:biopolymer transport protein ExbD
MGTVDTPQREAKAKKGGGLRRPKRRIGIKIDMTPMVDIAFLLLIFYMVTTVFSMPQSMEINLPPKSEDTPLPIPVSKLLEIMVDEQGNVFWFHSPEDNPMELPEYIESKDLRRFLIRKNQEVEKLVTVLRIDPKARYEIMVNIVDEIQVVERLFKQADPAWSYRFSLQDMTEWEHQQMERAKAAMGMTAQAGEESS